MKNNVINIIKYLSNNGPSKPSQISAYLGCSRPSCHKLLAQGTQDGYISKHGKTPHVTYDITDLVYKHNLISQSKTTPILELKLNFEESKILSSFYKFDNDGSLLLGKKGFATQCQKRLFNKLVT